MNFSFSILPKTEETLYQFRQMVLAPDQDVPSIQMNDETARDLTIIWNSIERCSWRGHRDAQIIEMPVKRQEYWGAFASDHDPMPLPMVEDFLNTTSGEGKLAIDLGCGNSPATQKLLRKGWRVIGIDYSKYALEVLAAKFRSQIDSGQLKIIEQDVTEFLPEEPADLVIAADILPYINPLKFKETWQKIHTSFLKREGIFIGTLFRSSTKPEQLPQMNLQKEMGAWFLPDRRMARPLLTSVGYEIQTCKFRIDIPGQEPTCIQFTAKKITD